MPKDDYWDQGWNIISGCTNDYECWQRCYARRMARRLAGRFGYPAAPNHFQLTWHQDRLQEPLKWGKPKRVLLASMGDWLHPGVSLDYVDDVLEVIGACPQHTFLSLTKRVDTMEHQLYGHTERTPFRELGGGDYLPNLWLGVSVSRPADLWRVEELLQIPAAVRWVSFEPALEEVDFKGFLQPYWNAQELSRRNNRWGTCVYCPRDKDGTVYPERCKFTLRYDHTLKAGIWLDWIVAGPETGPGARSTHLDVFRHMRDQCQETGTPFWYKGGELDGKTWHQLPEVKQ